MHIIYMYIKLHYYLKFIHTVKLIYIRIYCILIVF